MEKASMEVVDLDDWEFLPDEHHHKGAIFSNEFNFVSKGVVDVNYFIIRPSLPSPSKATEEEVKEFKDIEVVPQDVVSQVFFKKWKENEFVDKKLDLELDLDLDSPKSITKASISGALCFDDDDDDDDDDEEEKKIKEKKPWCDGFGITVWRWSLCSIGLAAATVCILFLGGKPRPKQHHQSHRLQFQMYSDEQRIKQVVQQASRLNQALSTMGGAASPLLARSAQISFGGYYDGL